MLLTQANDANALSFLTFNLNALMNNIRSQAEETILNELIYS